MAELHFEGTICCRKLFQIRIVKRGGHSYAPKSFYAFSTFLNIKKKMKK